MTEVQRPARPAWAAAWAAGAAATLLAACAMGGGKGVEPEAFGSTNTHARNFDASPAFTCEAARRALLSQGFLIFGSDTEHVNGRKNFQPEVATHVEIEFHATCVADGRGGRKSIAFVNALQDRYALKKSNNSASVGVGAIGSLSLPFTSSDDAMVKVASETITSEGFYEKFFKLLDRYMVADSDMLPDPKADAPVLVPEPTRPGRKAGAEMVAPAASAAMPAASAASAASLAASAASAAAADIVPAPSPASSPGS